MGTQLPLPKRHSPSIFGPYLLRPNGCMDQDVTWYGGRPRPRQLCVRWGPRSPSPKGGQSPRQIFGPCLLRPNGWMDEAGTWHGGKPQPKRLCGRSSVISHHRHQSCNAGTLQPEMDNIATWAAANNVRLNVLKSKDKVVFQNSICRTAVTAATTVRHIA